MNKKIAFFDVDGTLTSEIDGSILETTITSIKKARENGNLMFINTGRCYTLLEKRFKNIGFDGYICGCGTNIYLNEKEMFHISQTREITLKILEAARIANVDLLFESKEEVCFDTTRPLKNKEAEKLFLRLSASFPYMSERLNSSDFVCDKFVIWYTNMNQVNILRKCSDNYFECIDRGNNFMEFIPLKYSKASGLQSILDYYNLPIEQAYVFGDSNNDLSMLSYTPNSIAMGNSFPPSLFKQVSYITSNASNHGIMNALKHFSFI